jgi:stage V sporulation protein R
MNTDSPSPDRVLERLPSPSDWTFELIETYHTEIAKTAKSYGLDVYPNQLEVITAEQMMDAYASVGMPMIYRHWSYGKQFITTEKNYKRGHMGLAYEIVINSDPCIAYLMEENTMAMQALVIAHAAYGHNSFFKGNYLFRMWTDASSIIDYLVYARHYIAECEERHGLDAVEELLDSCHALMNYGVDRYRRPQKRSLAQESAQRADRERHMQQQVNDLWRTLPRRAEQAAESDAGRRFPSEPQENLLYFIEKNAALLEPWQREGGAHRAQDRAVLLSAAPDAGHERRLGHLLALHAAQHHVRPRPARRRFHDGMAQLAHGRDLPAAGRAPCLQRHQPVCVGLRDVHRPAARLREADRGRPPLVPRLRGQRLAQDARLRHAQLQGRELHRQFLSPKTMRDFRLFSIRDYQSESELEVSAIHDDSGYHALRESLSRQYDISSREPDIQVWNVATRGDRSLTLRHTQRNNLPLHDGAEEVLKHVARLWGFDVHLESIDSAGRISRSWKAAAPRQQN